MNNQALERVQTKQPLAAPQIRPMDKARLGVVCTVYHQHPGAEPITSDARFSRWLDTDEQPYLRRLTVKEEWMPLDLGWLEKAGMLTLRNEEGRFAAKPTDAEKAAVMERVLLLALLVGDGHCVFAVVRPLECVQFEPANLAFMRLRCRSGQAKATLTLFPA